MTLEDLVYTAGLFDGDGCISVTLQEGQYHSSEFVSIKVEIALLHHPTIEWLQGTFGGSSGSQTINSGNVLMHWRIHGRKSEEFLRGIFPYLRVKKDQVEIALAILEVPDRRNDETRLIKRRLVEMMTQTKLSEKRASLLGFRPTPETQ